jgi:hypothetical protein
MLGVAIVATRVVNNTFLSIQAQAKLNVNITAPTKLLPRPGLNIFDMGE